MQINFAHVQDQGINFAVFEADSTDRTRAGRAETLARLTAAARRLGLRVEKSALAFMESGRVQFYGTPDLVDYLASGGVPSWTHTLTI